MSHDWRARLQGLLPASQVTLDAPLHLATSLRIGGPAACLVDVGSEEDLLALFEFLRQEGQPYTVLGKGSNVLAPDAGLPGVVLRLGRGFAGLRPAGGPGHVQAGAGLPNATLVEQARALGLGGMEFLVCIPGNVGGAIAMNAGAHGQDTAGSLVAVRTFEPGRGIQNLAAQTLEFGYRQSPLRADQGRLVLGGIFQLQPLPDGEIQARKARLQAWRRASQPRDFPNCGSVFKNPPGDFAARLIDEAGLKGHQVGGAQVSEKHANFIVNRGGARAADVLALIDFIQETLYERKGVRLQLELQVLAAPLPQPHSSSAPAPAGRLPRADQG